MKKYINLFIFIFYTIGLVISLGLNIHLYQKLDKINNEYTSLKAEKQINTFNYEYELSNLKLKLDRMEREYDETIENLRSKLYWAESDAIRANQRLDALTKPSYLPF
jgi:outer membrane murein-binding lipoprotein Lpp